MAENTEGQAGQNGNMQQFALQRIYIKDLSFEVPLGAAAYDRPWKPTVQVELNTSASPVDAERHEVVLTITLKAQLEEEVAFLIELQQAGVFIVRGVEGEQLRQVLMIGCPTILFPYARETIDAMALKGSFPPVMLQPVNFEALYLQARQQAEQQAAGNLQ
jgi:preprotein translocase subunit SecB